MANGYVEVEIPESCKKCPFFLNLYNDMTCRAARRTIDYPYPADIRQKWCPIRELPEGQITRQQEGDKNV